MESDLILLVKQHVDKILYDYIVKYGVSYGDEKLRDDTVIYVINSIYKKYINDSRFENKKDLFIRTITISYLFKVYLDKTK